MGLTKPSKAIEYLYVYMIFRVTQTQTRNPKSNEVLLGNNHLSFWLVSKMAFKMNAS